MMITRQTIPITTDASGDATVYTGDINGRLTTIIYSKGTLDTIDISVVGETSGAVVWAESAIASSKTLSPRRITNTTTGDDATYPV